MAALTKECWVPHLKVDKYEIRKALSTISLEDIQRYGVFPVDKLGSILNLAMINPLDESAIQHIDSKTGLEVKKLSPRAVNSKPASTNILAATEWQVLKSTLAKAACSAKTCPQPTPALPSS